LEVIDIYKWAKENHVARASAIPDLKGSGKFLSDLKIDTAVEIGTCYGISAAHLAQYVKKLHTFDVQEFPCRQLIWDTLGLSDKISFHLIEDRRATRKILQSVDFDFAFIDARHEVKEVIKDHRLVKRCGRVLFHDVDSKRYPDNHKFLKMIGGKMIFNNVGYWEENGR